MIQIRSAAAVLVAAGNSRRMKGNTNKVLELLNNRPILSYSLEAFQRNAIVQTVTVVCREEDRSAIARIIRAFCPKAEGHITIGGAERFDSVKNGLEYLYPFQPDAVLIHDAARPFLRQRFIADSVDALTRVSACLVGVAVKDTVKETDENGTVTRTHERNRLRLAQTPQTFRYMDILQAYRAVTPPPYPTDDAAVFEMTGGTVRMVEGSYENIKITTPEDLIMAESLLKWIEP
ncbi:MAG: 2-C-methyl-D-erythritol 4-phosphate cytidylyltransferase [Candidatus Omnitrophota bacterium]|jgi:2-C-methyl-D-erythritol 4-phosphate cytidylyltransferase|nr:MAG: 2-C-methyl-D-erythritol 4-phosphate cytidylyltransferase [Candidatus Omnitrophota bacterium]